MRGLLILVSIIVYGSLFAQVITVSGNITSNTTWSADTILIVEDVTIDSSYCLTISPGTYIKAMGFYRINVNGTVLSVGTTSDSIIFSVNDTNNYHLTDTCLGGWGGIHFVNTPNNQDSSKFEYCRFEFGKAVDTGFVYLPGNDGGAFHIDNYSKICIRNCYFKHNYAKHNGGAICSYDSDLDISYNTFYKNNGLEHGGGICTSGGIINVSNNLFFKNMTGG